MFSLFPCFPPYLGRAEAANSGINGGWSQFQSSFDNSYYLGLVGLGWNRDGNNVWLGPAEDEGDRLIMLQGDVELAIEPAEGCPSFNRNLVAGAGSNCPLNLAAVQTVQEYASPGGTEIWWRTFATAWEKMMSAGITAPLQGAITQDEVAQSLEPSPAPNVAPSIAPSLSPTAAPSVSPTDEPIATPTAAPTLVQAASTPSPTNSLIEPEPNNFRGGGNGGGRGGRGGR